MNDPDVVRDGDCGANLWNLAPPGHLFNLSVVEFFGKFVAGVILSRAVTKFYQGLFQRILSLSAPAERLSVCCRPSRWHCLQESRARLSQAGLPKSHEMEVKRERRSLEKCSRWAGKRNSWQMCPFLSRCLRLYVSVICHHQHTHNFNNIRDHNKRLTGF